MKKLISVIMSVVIITAFIISSVYAQAAMSNFKKAFTYSEGQYIDVTKADWYKNNVAQAYEYGLMKGTSENFFNAYGNIKVSEVIAVAARLHSIYMTGQADFSPSDPWYQSYVNYAVYEGIISKNRFENYELNATRYQVAEIFASALPSSEFKEINSINLGDIPDVSLDSFYQPVYTLYRAGVLTGKTSKGDFYPAENVLRSEIAAIATRVANENIRVKFTIDSSSNGNASSKELIESVNFGRETIALAMEAYRAAYSETNTANKLAFLAKAKEYTLMSAQYTQNAAVLCRSNSKFSAVYDDIYNTHLACLKVADHITSVAAAPSAESTDWGSALSLLIGSGEALSRAAETINKLR